MPRPRNCRGDDKSRLQATEASWKHFNRNIFEVELLYSRNTLNGSSVSVQKPIQPASMSDHQYKFNVSMSCGGCSGAVERVLKKLDGESFFLSARLGRTGQLSES